MRRLLKRMAIIVAIFLAVACAAAFWLLRHPMFGSAATGARLERMRQSPNYANGEFRNRIPKPHMVEGVSMPRLAWDFLVGKKERARPSRPLPTVKTDLSALPSDRDALLWLGHSSLFMQVAGKRYLVDPNFTSYASPFFWRTYSFDGTDLYSPEEIPEIDCLLITHDHFDHLNYDTVVAIKDKVNRVVCPLGVGEHLEYWGVPPGKITELDWDESAPLDGATTLHAVSTHHFSGRTLGKRNPTLWAAFVLETPERRLYIGGDSGYGPHFAETGVRFGGFDLAILENGQYDPNWRYNHLFPEETARAARDLGAKRMLPVHAGRFVLANHPWDDPFRRIAEAAAAAEIDLATPLIGEPVLLDSTDQQFTRWWEGID